MITAKPRVIFAILFGLLGIPAAFLAAMAVTGGLTGVLWLYVFGDDRWPAWTGPFITTCLYAAAAGTFGISVILGVQYGRILEKTADAAAISRKLRLTTGLTLIIWVLFGSWCYINYRKDKIHRNRYLSHQEAVTGLKKIGAVNLEHADTDLNVKVDLAQGRPGTYETILEVAVRGYVSGVLWEESRENWFSEGQEPLEFSVPIGELARQYRDQLAARVSSFDQKLQLDEAIEVRVRLNPVSEKFMPAYGIPKSEAVRYLDVTVSCQGPQCRFIKIQERQ